MQLAVPVSMVIECGLHLPLLNYACMGDLLVLLS